MLDQVKQQYQLTAWLLSCEAEQIATPFTLAICAIESGNSSGSTLVTAAFFALPRWSDLCQFWVWSSQIENCCYRNQPEGATPLKFAESVGFVNRPGGKRSSVWGRFSPYPAVQAPGIVYCFRRQGRTSRALTECPKADINYGRARAGHNRIRRHSHLGIPPVSRTHS